MRYIALACDYDGTLAHDGTVADETVVALERLRESGRTLVLVTGRELDDLMRVFARLDLFDRVVVENGALLYCPATREERRLAEPPPQEFVDALRARGVPLSVGRVIVATVSPHEIAVLDVIHELGLELQVIFNKGSVMILPSGTNKATGLAAALDGLGLSLRNVVGVGDAENDHAFLATCECAVAVANALPTLKERADLVTAGARGAGVVELIQTMIVSDLRELAPRLGRHRILLGTRADGSEVTIEPYGTSVVVAGASGSDTSTLAVVMLERLAAHGYQFCVVDSEGDYESLAGAVVLGARDRPPVVTEVLDLFEKPSQNVVVNLAGVALEDRPRFFATLLSRIQELRARRGRPHWIIVDEAHHVLPASWDAANLPQTFDRAMMLTSHPHHLARVAAAAADIVIAAGETAPSTIRDFAAARGVPPPAMPDQIAADELVVWNVAEPAAVPFRVIPSSAEHRRRR